AVVPIRSLLLRVERAQELAATAIADGREEPAAVGLPMEVHAATWAAISPPRGGSRAVPGPDAAMLEQVARAGITEVAEVVPEAVGESTVRRGRGEVWGRELGGAEHIPAGAGIAAGSLGVMAADEVTACESGAWTRRTTRRGHVLVRRR